MQIHQLVPALHDADAIGDSARAMRDYLRGKGFASDIYAFHIDESISAEGIDFYVRQPSVGPGDLLILHFALPSGMTEFLKRAACKKAIIYHNITPAYYWLPYDPSLVHLATAGRKELESLAPFIEAAAGDSEYNCLELERLQFRKTCVVPIYVKRERYEVTPSPMIRKTMEDGLFNFLFVGRIAPNKKLEDVLALYALYKKMIDPLSRLILVGKTTVAPAYFAALQDARLRLGIMPEDVVYAGHVDWPELVAYYRSSHVFVSMSEHEGFCVPLVEAMICDTPIVAYSSTAIPYTLGNAGIQFTDKKLDEIAGICRRIQTDPAFREAILQTQRAQLAQFEPSAIEAAIDRFLEPLISAGN